MEITKVSETDLEQEAVAQGPTSAAATILAALALKRAKDRQVFAWQVGSYYFVGPPPDAKMEALIREFIDADAD